MQPIPETGQQELVWVQPRARTLAYELYAGETLVATLSWQKGSQAEANAAGCQWIFERGGFWHSRITARAADSDAEVAALTSRWDGTGTLECAGGRRFRWSAENLWHTQWAWQDADGIPLMHFGGKPGAEKGGRASKGVVELTPAAVALTELPLLVLLGWYLVVLHAQHVATTAATTASRVAIGH